MTSTIYIYIRVYNFKKNNKKNKKKSTARPNAIKLLNLTAAPNSVHRLALVVAGEYNVCMYSNVRTHQAIRRSGERMRRGVWVTHPHAGDPCMLHI